MVSELYMVKRFWLLFELIVNSKATNSSLLPHYSNANKDFVFGIRKDHRSTNKCVMDDE